MVMLVLCTGATPKYLWDHFQYYHPFVDGKICDKGNMFDNDARVVIRPYTEVAGRQTALSNKNAAWHAATI